MKILILLMIVLFQVSIVSQEVGEVKGIVSDLRNGKPLSQITVSISDSLFVTHTDSMGKYNITNIPVGKYKLAFDGYPFQSKQEYIKIIAGSSKIKRTSLAIDTIKAPGILDTATISFAFFPDKSGRITKDDLSIKFYDNQFSYSLNGDNFAGDKFRYDTKDYQTSIVDSLYISFVLSKPDKVLVSDSFSIPLVKDRAYSIEFHIQEVNPIHTCWGCGSSKSYPLGCLADDSLFVIFSGHSITFPAIY